MKRALIVIMAALILTTLYSCTSNPGETGQAQVETPASADIPATSTPEQETPTVTETELIVFAAASMTETLTEIATLYKESAPHVTLTFNFDSSGTLLTQIKEGAACDVFISAAQRQMNALDLPTETNPDGLDYITPGTRFDLVENRVALAVPPGNPADITSFDDVADVTLIALGNSDVPVGQYSEEIFINMGIWDMIQDRITFGSNVKEVTSWVIEGAVDCGVVYSTDAYSAGLEIVAYAPDGTLNTPVLYPAAALKESDKQAESGAFLEFLQSEAAAQVFESVGFAIPQS